MSPRPCPLVAAAALALIGFAPAAMPATPPFRVAPPAPWVEELPLPADGIVPSREVSYGKYYLIDDSQAQVGATTSRYVRRAWKVLSTAGVQEASEIRMDFDPSYQNLVIHDVRLWREGLNVRSFKAADVQLIHQEDELSERIYNGSLTALVFRYAGSATMAYRVPVRHRRYRVTLPAARTPHFKAHRTSAPPEVREASGRHSFTWEAKDVPALDVDDDVPGWYEPYPAVYVSEFESWNEVARWANRLFTSQRQPSPRLAALARKWMAAGSDEEARALLAIRFVQDEVRYLGIEMGPNSHQPHPPAQVLEQRFGDCKDKALLLTALLNEMGIEAWAALVNTEAGHALDDYPPTPYAFDHVIVAAQIAGKRVWIDATRSELGGRPTSWEPPGFERALLVRDDTEELTRMTVPPRSQPTRTVEETYTVSAWTEPVRLTVRTRYEGPDADDKRQSLARMSPADVAKRHLNHYAQDVPGARALAPPSFEDDREQNVIVAQESYELPGFWTDGRHRFYAWAVGDWLNKPAPLRTMPLALPHPVHVAQKLTVNLPEALGLRPEREEIDEAAFRLRARIDPDGKVLRLSYSYESLGDSLPGAETHRHRAAIDRAEDALTYVIRRDRLTSIGEPHGARALWIVAGVAVVVVAGFGVRAIPGVRRRRAFRRSALPLTGETPATALRVDAVEDIGRLLEGRSCGCGGKAGLQEGERHSVLYEGRRMWVVVGRCAGCGRERTIYVTAKVDDRSPS
jgi:transglutaminase-like putative cysteine protease